jgi:hypothetical protein
MRLNILKVAPVAAEVSIANIIADDKDDVRWLNVGADRYRE